MRQDTATLVWEITVQDGALKMSILGQHELLQSVRHYSESSLSARQLHALCQEITSVLTKSGRKGALESESLQKLKKVSGLLWDQLVTKPVKERLQGADTRNLVLTIDEELISIPWELLYTGEYFLCLKFSIGRLVRTKQPQRQAWPRNVSLPPKMLIIANPTNDLKAAYREGLQVRNYFGGKRSGLHVDLKTTCVDTLYVKKNLRDYDIVHFAGHCEYEPEAPLEAGWVLSDGRFRAQDILSLGEGVSLPVLVFSNACCSAQAGVPPTGKDYQERAYGLAAAFLFAGVKLYVGAVWKLEDPASFIFAREFYARLIRRVPVGECVRLARLRLIKECGLANIHWANYLLYGDPAFLPLDTKRKQKACFLGEPRVYKETALRLGPLLPALGVCALLFFWLFSFHPGSRLTLMRSRSYAAAGRNEEAAASCERLIRRDPAFLDAYPLLAEAQYRQGRRAEALQTHFAYALESQKKNDASKLADAYIGIGWLYHQCADYAKAFDFYTKAIEVSGKQKDKLHEAVALRKMAVWYIDKEDYDKALELLTKSSEINRERRHLPGYAYNLACDYFDIGLVFSNKDDFKAAREFYVKAQALFERLRAGHEMSDYYFNLGEICLFEKDYQKAFAFYLKGLRIDEEQGNKPSLAADYNMLGELYAETGNRQEAERFFCRAVLLAREIQASPELACAYRNLADLYKEGGQSGKARGYLLSAREVCRSLDTPEFREISQELEELQ